jgi:TolA-binding protein
MSLANDEMGPMNRIRELEEENSRLRQDNIELRRELEDRSAQFLRPDIGRRTSDFSNDSYRGDSNGANTAAWGDFEYKKSGRLSNGPDADRDYLLVCSLSRIL